MLACGAAAAATVAMFAAPAHAATLTTTTPTLTGLVTGDLVTLNYSGSSLAAVDFFQCTRTATSFGDCQALTQQTMTLDFGEGTMDFSVDSTGCVPDLCSIWAVEDPTSFAGGTAPHIDIEFAAEPPPAVPEVPMALLLPLGAGAVLGLGALANRRRHSAVGI